MPEWKKKDKRMILFWNIGITLVIVGLGLMTIAFNMLGR